MNMSHLKDLKELFRAEIGIVQTEVKALREDSREIKDAISRFQTTCNGKHGDLTTRVSDLEREYSALQRERKLFLGGLAIALTGAVKGLFDWLAK